MKRGCWVRPSLKSGRAEYSVNDFISDEVDKLNQEYWFLELFLNEEQRL